MLIFCLLLVLLAGACTPHAQKRQTATRKSTAAETLAKIIRSAGQGDTHAQYTLGLSYEKGIRVRNDYIKAEHWYKKAAMQGHAPAQHALGTLYQSGFGKWGLRRNNAKAYAWLILAAANANGDQNTEHFSRSRDQLRETMDAEEIAYGRLYAQTLRKRIIAKTRPESKPRRIAPNVQQRPQRAPVPATTRPPLRSLQELQEAGRQGSHTAADRLGQMYARGQGVPQDLIKAYAWTRVLIRRGGNSESAAERLYWLAERMPMDDIDTAHEMADDLHKRIETGEVSNQGDDDSPSNLGSMANTAGCPRWNLRNWFEKAGLEEIQDCLDAGADPNARNEGGWTPLHNAVVSLKHPAVVKVLLDAGANPNARLSQRRETPLHFAANFYPPGLAGKWPAHGAEVIKLLFRAGADIEAKDLAGRTPLHYAAGGHHPAEVEALLEAGANPYARDGFGDTPFYKVRRR